MAIIAAALVGLIPTGILAVLLWHKERQLDSFVDSWGDNVQSVLEGAAKERAQLIAQIQRPDISPTIAAPVEPDGPMHLPMDDDEAYADYREAVKMGELT